VELTELIKDYVATELLSSIEIDFLEGELWETTQHISEINTVIKAPKNICKKLGLDEKSCWQLCCAAVLDSSRPVKHGQKRVDDFKKLFSSNTPLAILFSGLTTIFSFSTLFFSSHNGTSSMGLLLFISLSNTLITSLILLPIFIKIFRIK